MKQKGSAVVLYIHPALSIVPDLECTEGMGGRRYHRNPREMQLLCSGFMGSVLGKGPKRE